MTEKEIKKELRTALRKELKDVKDGLSNFCNGLDITLNKMHVSFDSINTHLEVQGELLTEIKEILKRK